MSAQKIADSLIKGIGIAILSITPDFSPPPKRGTGR